MPGLNGSSLGGKLPLDPFFVFGVVEEGKLLEDEWEGSQPVIAVSCLDLFSVLLAFFLGSLDVFCCFLFGWAPHFQML